MPTERHLLPSQAQIDHFIHTHLGDTLKMTESVYTWMFPGSVYTALPLYRPQDILMWLQDPYGITDHLQESYERSKELGVRRDIQNPTQLSLTRLLKNVHTTRDKIPWSSLADFLQKGEQVARAGVSSLKYDFSTYETHEVRKIGFYVVGIEKNQVPSALLFYRPSSLGTNVRT